MMIIENRHTLRFMLKPKEWYCQNSGGGNGDKIKG